MNQKPILASDFREQSAKALFEKMNQFKIEPERAKEIAEELAKILPDDTSENTIYSTIPTLLAKYPELGEVIYRFHQTQDEGLKNLVLESVKVLMKEGNTLEAQKILQELKSKF
jgi:hypothetical protein